MLSLNCFKSDHDKELNFVLNLEKKYYQCPEITEVDYNHLYPCSSRPGIYGLTKVHKPVTDQHASLQLILLAIS